MSPPDPADTSDPSDAFDVPADAAVVRCPRCDRPFLEERPRDIHLGRAHGDLTAEERAAYGAALEAEREELERFRIVALGLLVLLYFGFLFLFAVAG